MKKIPKIIKIILCDIIISALIIASSYVYYYKMPQNDKGLGIIVENPYITKQSNHSTKSATKNINSSYKKVSGSEYTTNWKNKFAKYFTDSIVSTDMSYKSQNISVNIEKKSIGSSLNKTTYYVADIHIASMDCFSTKFANDTYGVGYEESLQDMSSSVNAMLAINGDSYSNNRHKNNGMIVRNGIIYRIQLSPYDICALYYDGTMKTYSSKEFDTNQAVKDGVCQTWIFGPELLDDNGKAKTSFFTWDYIRKRHPRSAIGYYEPGHYCMVLVDGRQRFYSRGMSLSELAKVFEDLGCKSAYNLDGGHCSFMTLNSNVVNHPYKQKNTISDCIIIKEP